jgi:putative restriction endonuclease
MADRIFGHIPGILEGAVFESRRDLSTAGVHRPLQAGISGTGKEGADSIVLSGAYEDDQDSGALIIYTGHGGRDPKTGQQVSDQLLFGGNLALATSCLDGLSVRVIRKVGDPWRPARRVGYRYDGLYRVESYWRDIGKSGFTIWRFRLTKLIDPSTTDKHLYETQESYLPPARQAITTLRIIRDTQQARQIKQLYDYRCQVCTVRLEGSAGPYAEAAHIRPLGAPHNGPDTIDNLLCLCPNHHVLFDFGGFAIDHDLTLVGLPGKLICKPEHPLNADHLLYHRLHYYKGL